MADELSTEALNTLDRMFRRNQASCNWAHPRTWLELKDAGFVKPYITPYGGNWLYYRLTDKGKAYKRLTDPQWTDTYP